MWRGRCFAREEVAVLYASVYAGRSPADAAKILVTDDAEAVATVVRSSVARYRELAAEEDDPILAAHWRSRAEVAELALQTAQGGDDGR